MDKISKTIMPGLFVMSLILITSCDLTRKNEKEEKERIEAYVGQNNITVSPTASDLYYVEYTGLLTTCI